MPSSPAYGGTFPTGEGLVKTVPHQPGRGPVRTMPTIPRKPVGATIGRPFLLCTVGDAAGDLAAPGTGDHVGEGGGAEQQDEQRLHGRVLPSSVRHSIP